MSEHVTFYRTYGFLENDVWQIPLRAWVHEDALIEAAIGHLPGLLQVTAPDPVANFRRRFRAFIADSESRQAVTIRFDEDPARLDRRISDAARTDLNGLLQGTIRLSRHDADALMQRQGSRAGWLTFRASSSDHSGVGHVQLIPPAGVSVVSDIDDTVKETHVPAGATEVLQNTFFRPFVAADGMATMYRGMADAAFHYVSGGPFQLYDPIAEFLFGPEVAFPHGTVHMKVIPKHVPEFSTWDAISRLLINPDATFVHKEQEISQLMRRFPRRKFVLIGDSGERDPDVYRHLRQQFGEQVQEIRIRDVIDDRTKNPSRLAGMTVVARAHDRPAPLRGDASAVEDRIAAL